MKTLAFLILLLLCPPGLHTQQQRAAKSAPPSLPLSVLTVSAFTDYYYTVQSPNAAAAGENAFDLRRLNIGFEHRFTRTVSVFTQAEANNGETRSGSNYSLFLKQAFVEVRNILPQMRVVMGLSPTPAVATSERIWRYRSLQKTPLEIYGMAPSVDNGIAMKGKIDPDGIVAYHVMAGNGTGTLREADKIKRLYASMGLTPLAGFTMEGYADFENAGNDRYRASFKGLIGLEAAEYAIGLEGIYRINHHTLTPWYNQSPFAVAVYGWAKASETVRIVYRGDYYDDDQNKLHFGLRTVEVTLGLDVMPVPEVHVIPNIVYTSDTNKDASLPKSDDGVTLRLTAVFGFSSPL